MPPPPPPPPPPEPKQPGYKEPPKPENRVSSIERTNAPAQKEQEKNPKTHEIKSVIKQQPPQQQTDTRPPPQPYGQQAPIGPPREMQFRAAPEEFGEERTRRGGEQILPKYMTKLSRPKDRSKKNPNASTDPNNQTATSGYDQ